MRRPPFILAVVLAAALLAGAAAGQSPPTPATATKAEEKVRELYIPYDDLNVLLEGGTQRVLLPRKEYADLLEKARKRTETRAPVEAMLVSADYAVTTGQERADITATLVINVLEDGLQPLALDVFGVGLRSARLDDKNAAIGLADDGRLTLFVEGKGAHKLTLEMVAPIQTTAATQVLNFRLPSPPAVHMAVTLPGDVEVKAGAAVVSRVFDEKAGQTRLELLPPKGDVSLVMSLNSRLKRKDRIVMARSVLVDEITQAYERLHATVSLAVLHRAADKFRFAIPAGFEVTDVQTPLLARWAIQVEGDRRILEVQLREETTDTVVLTLSAIRTPASLEAWSFPRLAPLDGGGHVAVVGLVVEECLKPEAITTQGLIPIDAAVLTKALPATVLAPDLAAIRIRPVAAYYAPQSEFSLSARFTKPPARLLVTTNLLLTLEDKGQAVRGALALVPEAEKVFSFDFTVPAGWDVTSVTADNQPLRYERYGKIDEAARIHVLLPSGLDVGQERRVFFQATSVPKNWFGDWKTVDCEFPVFAVEGAARDTGAIAVDARDDMTVRPDTLEGLISANEYSEAPTAGTEARLAYSFQGRPYRARLIVQRKTPYVTAQTFSFFRIERDTLIAHYELVYDIAEARTRSLSLVLPEDTPSSLKVRGLDNVALKEYTSAVAGKAPPERRWTATLADNRKGRVRLAVDFEQRLAADLKELVLPIVRAAGVAFQSGLVAVEGSPEVNVQVTEFPRKVDIGELVDAEYQPGKRLLGAYGFVGEPVVTKVAVSREPQYALPPAIVQRAEMATVVSAQGLGQTAARFRLKTKALFLEIKLPPKSTLWSATLDGRACKPQREGDSVLVSLPPGPESQLRDLQVVYETPLDSLGLWKSIDVPAPRLSLHASASAAGQEVPMADLEWALYLPTGYRVVHSAGTVARDPSQAVEGPQLAVSMLAGEAWHYAGGTDPGNGLFPLFLAVGTKSMMSTRLAKDSISSESDYSYKSAADAKSTAEKSPAAAAPRAGQEEHRSYELDARKLKHDVNGDTAGLTDRPVTEPPPAAPKAETAEPSKLVLTITGGATFDVNGSSTVTGRLSGPVPAKPSAGKAKVGGWAMEGVSSLQIALDRSGQPILFSSLGEEPRLSLTVAGSGRLRSLMWGLALAVLLVGVAMTGRSAGRKAAYIIGVGLVATALPVVTGRLELALVTNGMFWAAFSLIGYYLLVAIIRWVGRKVFKRIPGRLAAGVSVVLLVGAALAIWASTARGAESAAPYVIQVVPPPAPVKVPDDALLLPYDPASKTGIKDVDKLLVPYARYEELWNQAYPDKPLDARKPPEPYAMAGAAFTATLKGEDVLVLEGSMEIDVYTDEYAIVPLPLEGGVLARADLDGKPAKLSLTQVEGKPTPKAATQALSKSGATAQKVATKPGVPGSFIVLYASGKGRHRLDLEIRMRLDKRGGWRVAEGWLPAAPATALTLKVPDAGTEVRLGSVRDRPSYETKAAGETIATALGADGAVSIQWRPKVAEGQLDQSLTATSRATFDVQEDQNRITWALDLEFRKGEREFFSVTLPPGYLVEKVEGSNVRGWEVREPAASGAAAGPQTLEVGLLKPAKERESFSITLWHSVALPQAPGKAVEFDVPVVGVVDAVRQTGYLLINRSPLLDLRTTSATGVTRADLPTVLRPRRVPNAAPTPTSASAVQPAGAADESPLGIRPFEAYQFATVPFTVHLAADPVALHTSAVVQTILRLAERERKLECRVTLTAENRPLYRARLAVPADLRIDRVQAPDSFEWAAADDGPRKIVTVYLAAGVQGQVPILIEGKLGQDAPKMEVDLPGVEVLDVDRQEGDIVVQADPALEVRVEGLKNAERLLLARVFSWLTEAQRGLAQVAIHYTQPGYAGRLVLAPRKPDVACFTVSNSRVTDRTIQDAILIDWTIRNAGIREVSFLLPAWMKDARISVPMLRQKTVTPVGPEAGALLRVRLELQDDVMDSLRVLIENDRLLTGERHDVPIPVVETGRTDRRYVAIESAGRDEVIVEKADGLEPLSRQQKEWAAVAKLLRGGQTQAFIVAAGAEKPQLVFQTKERAAVETARARIGLAETVLVMDASGAYRAQQTYHIDNRLEQFLEVQMPEGAVLWTAVVAGEPVKPTVLDTKVQPRAVRIPLIKTAAGELDYKVVLKYAGKLPALGSGRVSVDFPLIRTTNINVELSQVELRLPADYTWFDFGGTARRITEEGTAEAGMLSYLNKKAENLVQTVKYGNPFEKARATESIKHLSQDIEQFKKDVGQFKGNRDLDKQITDAGSNMKVANDELVRQQQERVVETIDNNGTLRQAYTEQNNRRARGQVAQIGQNWNGSLTTTENPSAVQFNDAWLAGNNLVVKPPQGQPQGESGAAVDLYGNTVVINGNGTISNGGLTKQGGGRLIMNNAGNASLQNAQAPNASQLAQSEMMQTLQQQAGQPQAQAREEQKAQGAVADAVTRYQAKLEARSEVEQEVGGDRLKPLEVVGVGAGGSNIGGFEGLGSGRGGFFGAGGEAAAGLASLDIDLPQAGKQTAGNVYRFTTPRGEVEIRARAVSQPLVEGLERMGSVLLLTVVMLVVWRLIRRASFGRQALGTLSTAMIILGVLGLIFGMLPILALFVFLAGIVIKIYLRSTRLAARTAA